MRLRLVLIAVLCAVAVVPATAAAHIVPTSSVLLDVGYVNDRAPADPNEEPLPIYPEEPAQQFAQQPGVREHAQKKAKKTNANPSGDEVKQALTKLIQSLPKDAQKKFRAYVKQHRADIQLPEE